MIKLEEIEKLARLSRLELTESEKTKFQKDIGSILDYVNQIQDVSVSDVSSKTEVVKNVFREDEDPIPSGKHTRDIVEEFPQKEGDYLKVKKIL